MDPNARVLPEEVLHKIVEALGGSRTALLALAVASKQLSRISSPFLFSEVKFKDQNHLLEFLPLISPPTPRIAAPVGCMHVSFEDISGMDTSISAAIPIIHTQIQARLSLAVRLPRGQLPPTFLQVVGAWFDKISQLTLSGDFCEPAVLFSFVFSFQRLKSLTLVDLSLVEEDVAQPPSPFVLPQTLDRLAFIRCPSLVVFFDTHVMSHDWSSIQDLYIQAVFSLDKNGVWEMMGIVQGRLRGVENLTLDALFDEQDVHINSDMMFFFRPELFMRTAGPKNVRLNLAKVPSPVATNFLEHCAHFQGPHAVEVIDVHLPTSPDLWLGDGPDDEFKSLLEAVEFRKPANCMSKKHRAKLVIHGFGSQALQDTQAWPVGASAVWGLGRLPLELGDAGGEQAMRRRFGIV